MSASRAVGSNPGSPLVLPLILVAGLVGVLVASPLGADPPRSVSTTVTPTADGASASTGVTAVRGAYHPSRVLVRFRSGVRDFLAGSGAPRGFPGDPDLFLVPNPPGLSVPDVVQRYRANPNVIYAEPDFEVHTLDTIPDDPRWPQQWDMVKISAPAAWDTQKDAADVVVAVIDTGVDFTHPDLAANVDPANSFTCIGGACVPGGFDDHGHGTHVAGTIGAVTDNALGIAGINWFVKIISLKFLNSGGSGYISDATLVFNKMVQLKNGGLNVRVSNNSWGGGGYSQALKDAMAAAEAAGIVNVCAAGNNGQNVDANPMYPGAYDNRGIVSVVATDPNDVGAGFTNYGLAGSDLAAPGVTTLSTVPTGACPLCDATGYRTLSGTSMATPHVAGVMAALLHRNPLLTAAQARDVVLDRGSHDTLADARARSTSTGGRLNFFKAITNPRLFGPEPLNIFPTIAVGSDVFTSAGGSVTLSATTHDADPGDLPGLRTQWSKLVSTGSTWLFGWMLNALFPSPSGSSVSFTAPSLARTASVPYLASVADNRGGGASGQQFVTVAPSATPGAPPGGTLSVSSASVPVGGTVTVNFPVGDPEGTTTAWDLWAAGRYGSSGWCCFTGAAVQITFNSAGTYRIGAQAIDRELQLSTRPTTVVSVGGAVGTPPVARATLDKVSGTVPFSITVDMSASSAGPGNSIAYYFIGCGGGFTSGSGSPIGGCTFTTPGTYWLLLQVQDNTGQMDLVSQYVVAAPAPSGGGADTTPPTVSITTPSEGASVSGNVALTANASDPGGSGVAKVEFWLDAVGGTLLGTDTTDPYGITWNSTGTSTGPHKIYAVATDNAGKTGQAMVNVSVPAPPPPPPTVNISVPTTTPARKSTLVISATTSPATVARVEFYVNGSLVGTDTTAAYSHSWKVPAAAGKTYTLTARAYDALGQVGLSNSITVTAQ